MFNKLKLYKRINIQNRHYHYYNDSQHIIKLTYEIKNQNPQTILNNEYDSPVFHQSQRTNKES